MAVRAVPSPEIPAEGLTVGGVGCLVPGRGALRGCTGAWVCDGDCGGPRGPWEAASGFAAMRRPARRPGPQRPLAAAAGRALPAARRLREGYFPPHTPPTPKSVMGRRRHTPHPPPQDSMGEGGGAGGSGLPVPPAAGSAASPGSRQQVSGLSRRCLPPRSLLPFNKRF